LKRREKKKVAHSTIQKKTKILTLFGKTREFIILFPGKDKDNGFQI